MELLLLVASIASIVSLFACPIMASKKGRSAVGWFFLAFFFGWIPLIIICCLDPK